MIIHHDMEFVNNYFYLYAGAEYFYKIESTLFQSSLYISCFSTIMISVSKGAYDTLIL